MIISCISTGSYANLRPSHYTSQSKTSLTTRTFTCFEFTRLSSRDALIRHGPIINQPIIDT